MLKIFIYIIRSGWYLLQQQKHFTLKGQGVDFSTKFDDRYKDILGGLWISSPFAMFFNQKWKLKICFVCNYLWSTNNLFVSSLRFRINIAEQHKTIIRIVFYVKWKQSRTIHCVVTEETEIKCFSTNLKTDHWPHWPSYLFVTLPYITSHHLT